MTNLKEGRQLVWSEEFDGTKLDTAKKWKFNQTMWGRDRNYKNNSETVKVADGQLTLTAKKHTSRYLLPQGLTTKDRMNFTYGYVEMRAKIPFKRGAWPSFWMKSDTRFGKADFMAEIDIFEVFANSDTLDSNVHKWKGNRFMVKNHIQWVTYNRSVNNSYTFKDCENLNDEFHLYGMEWTPEYMAFYVDNNLYLKIDITENKDFGKSDFPGMQAFHDPCYLIMNNELITKGNFDPSWMSPDWLCQDTDLPIDYVIDYLRLYQKKGETIRLFK